MNEARERLKGLQSLPLERKILITQTRIIEWYKHYEGKVYVSFSGGKDSTVLLHLVRQLYPDVPAVFANTGLEYPEVRQFALEHENVEEVRPQQGGKLITFMEVVRKYGYPIIGKEVANTIDLSRGSYHSSRWRYLEGSYTQQHTKYDRSKYRPILDLPFRVSSVCCKVSKKQPLDKYAKATARMSIVAMMAEESAARATAWVQQGGCNAFTAKHPHSAPLSFWTEQDVLAYIVREGISICSVYGEIERVGKDGFTYPVGGCIEPDGKLRCSGCQRTGCIFCAFGAHLEKGETRFQRLKRTHPKHYEYCIGGGSWQKNDRYDESKPWHPKELWMPDKKGLGMGKVFDMLNDIYGKDFLRYE